MHYYRQKILLFTKYTKRMYLLNKKPGSDLLSHGESPHYHRHYNISLLSSAWGQVVLLHSRRQDYPVYTLLLFLSLLLLLLLLLFAVYLFILSISYYLFLFFLRRFAPLSQLNTSCLPSSLFSFRFPCFSLFFLRLPFYAPRKNPSALYS